jgi:hypothetical protein
VDDDDDDLDVDLKPDTMHTTNNNRQPSSPSLSEDLEVQDALLALRLRAFLKGNGVEEWMLKADSSPSSPPTSPVNPYPQESKMDVDVLPPPLPVVSNRHLVTVLRMRGGGGSGSRQNGGIVGLKFKKNKSKLRMCVYKDDDEGDD